MEREKVLSSTARFFVVRLLPGDEVLSSLKKVVSDNNLQAAYIAGSVGSLTDIVIRFAGNPEPHIVKGGKWEVVSLIGTLDDKAPHIYICISDENGKVLGGHLLEGCTTRTTLEVVLGELDGLKFSRAPCALSGYDELKISERK